MGACGEDDQRLRRPTGCTPESMPAMMSAYDALNAVQRQIVIAGTPQGLQISRQMLDLVWQRYMPNSIVMLADQGAGQKELARRLSFIATMRPRNGKATAYICQNYVCTRPPAIRGRRASAGQRPTMNS